MHACQPASKRCAAPVCEAGVHWSALWCAVRTADEVCRVRLSAVHSLLPSPPLTAWAERLRCTACTLLTLSSCGHSTCRGSSPKSSTTSRGCRYVSMLLALLAGAAPRAAAAPQLLLDCCSCQERVPGACLLRPGVRLRNKIHPPFNIQLATPAFCAPFHHTTRLPKWQSGCSETVADDVEASAQAINCVFELRHSHGKSGCNR